MEAVAVGAFEDADVGGVGGFGGGQQEGIGGTEVAGEEDAGVSSITSGSNSAEA